MSIEGEHLHPSIRPLLSESAEARIQRIRSDRWIAYARAESVVGSLEELLQYPKRTRMPNLLIVGPTNNGKTMIVEKFRRAHSPIRATESKDGVAHVPVVRIQMPAGPDERRFFGAMLEAVGMFTRTPERLAVRQDLAIRVARETDIRILVVDEVHNLLAGTSVQQRRLLNLLRWIGNELQIPIVAVGTAEALHAIQSDDQLANRFEPVGLPVWHDGAEFRQLLNTLESVLPLCRPSRLSTAGIALTILSMSEGILGEIVAIVSRAAIHGIRSGSESVGGTEIDAIGFLPPSQRRHVTV